MIFLLTLETEIGPSMRRYRQEDAHEFLRFSIDSMQNSAQHGEQ